MLNIFGAKHRMCDGISRRQFLKVGTLGLGGLTLTDLLRLKAQGSVNRRTGHKAVIMVYLAGGPSHIDMVDLKPDAPAEIRGEFKPIPTKVSGLDLCELMPLQAQIADRLAILRGVQTVGYHTGNEFFSGFAYEGKPGDQLRPALGSMIGRVKGPSTVAVPPYVSLVNPNSGLSTRAVEWEVPSYAGAGHQPFRAFNDERNSNQAMNNLRLVPGVSREQLEERKGLLQTFDTLRRDLDAAQALLGLDAMNAQALEMITSSKVRDALDLGKSPDRVRERYAPSAAHISARQQGLQFLQALRLVEAGVSVVTLMIPGWDTHTENFNALRRQVPVLDRCVHSLVTDLHERGLDQDVAVLVAGEMGRTPRISSPTANLGAGRDHWPQAGMAILAGGGLKMGQVVGATDARGELPKGRPIRPQNLMAMLYHVLGIDPGATIPDLNGRPMYLLDDREKLAELL